uniref:Recombinase family protein n=1 Tax=Neobacillus citreus TaxID=2833578 RepID=A0A942T212_9BACI
MIRAVLYLRLSSSSEDSTSITRQRRDLQERADREGWTIVSELVDDGVSGRKSRANAAEALRMLRDNEADVLAVWKFDRWSRQGLGAVAALVETLDAVPRARFIALSDGLSSDQPAWRIVASVLAEVARMEADNTAARVRSSIALRRQTADRYTGGATVPYGYRSAPAPDGVGRVLVLHPGEAAVVREISDRLLNNESQSSIARDLTERGIPTSRSARRRADYGGRPDDSLDAGEWRTHTIRDLMRSDTLLGRQRHRGDLIRDEHGLPRTVWPPVLDLPTVERLRAHIEPKPRANGPARRRAARLLSGLAYCEQCGGKLYVTTSGGRAVYKCATPTGSKRCTTSVTVDAERLEAFVADEYLETVGSAPELREVETVSAPETAAQLAEVESALREASAALLDDDADDNAIMSRVASLRTRRAELRAVPSTVTRSIQRTGRTIAEAWAASDTLEEKRAALALAFDHVAILPAGPTSRRTLNRERVLIRWREEWDGLDAAV